MAVLVVDLPFWVDPDGGFYEDAVPALERALEASPYLRHARVSADRAIPEHVSRAFDLASRLEGCGCHDSDVVTEAANLLRALAREHGANSAILERLTDAPISMPSALGKTEAQPLRLLSGDLYDAIREALGFRPFDVSAD